MQICCKCNAAMDTSHLFLHAWYVSVTHFSSMSCFWYSSNSSLLIPLDAAVSFPSAFSSPSLLPPVMFFSLSPNMCCRRNAISSDGRPEEEMNDQISTSSCIWSTALQKEEFQFGNTSCFNDNNMKTIEVWVTDLAPDEDEGDENGSRA